MPKSDLISSTRIAISGSLLVGLLLCLALFPVAAQKSDGLLALSTASYQLLNNPGVEVYDAPYAQFEGVGCQVATGWQRFWYNGPEPCWMDTRVFADSHLGTGWVEKIEGETSQLIVATEPYTAGIWQQVSGLTPGVGYGFHAAMLTIYQTSAPPAVDGTMIKQIGIDPTGGTDPRAPTVVWSEPDDHDEGPWDIEQRTAVYAQAPMMTVFVRVVSPHGSGGLPYLNYSFLDSAILARTPVVRATSPAKSDTLTFIVNWDNAVPAPDGGKLKWRDVQWMDEAEGVWHDWITQSYEVEAQFAGERGHTYRFRARAWQRYPNDAHLYGPYRPEGDTSTTVIGPKLTGRVLTNTGNPIVGATVAISGTTYAATSGSDGRFDLDVWPWPDPQIAAVSHPWWESPAPVYGVTFGLTETVGLTWTLRPPSEHVSNGEFEAGLDGWSLTATQGGSAEVVTDPVHTGHRALALEGAAPVAAEGSATLSAAVSVSQSVVLSDVWDPVLSFWYRPMTADTEERERSDPSTVFNVILTVAGPTTSPTSPMATTRVFTPDLDTTGWQHVWYHPDRPDAALTGTVTIQFQVRHREPEPGEATTVYLDEVSLGAAPGGPHRLYLPLTAKE